MPEIQTYRINWVHYTDVERRVVNNVDRVNWQELFWRGEVSDWVFNILMQGTLEAHDEQSKKLLKIK